MLRLLVVADLSGLQCLADWFLAAHVAAHQPSSFMVDILLTLPPMHACLPCLLCSPAGGLLFCIEEGASFYSTSIFWRGFLATCVGVLTLHILADAKDHPGRLLATKFGRFRDFGGWGGALQGGAAGRTACMGDGLVWVCLPVRVGGAPSGHSCRGASETWVGVLWLVGVQVVRWLGMCVVCLGAHGASCPCHAAFEGPHPPDCQPSAVSACCLQACTPTTTLLTAAACSTMFGIFPSSAA